MASHGKSPGMLLRNAGIFNPVLVQAVGLCPVVAMATSVKSAALLAAISAVIITLSELVASLFLKKVPRWVRIGLYIILGGAIVAPLMVLIERTNAPLFGSLGIYLPIMAVNSLNVLRCERFAVKISPLSALLDGITASVGYSAVLIVVGLIREVLGSGSILGFKFFEGRTMSGLLLPFGGFIMLGFSGAILRVLIAKFWPKYLDKKQPKPGFRKKHVADKKSGSTPAPVRIPEFAADEPVFSIDDISEQDDDKPQNVEPAEPTAVAEPEPAVVAEPEPAPHIEPHETHPAAVDVQSEVQQAETATETEKPQQHPEYRELSIDDLESASADVMNSSDDELEKLMNRSIGDILDKHEDSTKESTEAEPESDEETTEQAEDESDKDNENKEDDEE
ncbi:MAG: hypothetical protein IIW48_05305 [Clostridia bacterium]|nr:hypothetical protein [Clostridia bacterium]